MSYKTTGPRLFNARQGKPAGSVYIGRPSKWGNQYEIGRDGSREEVIEKYRRWICDQPGMVDMAKRELRGRDLTCWCAPLPCHGNVLMEIANA